jgi:hypothetical protein
MIGSSIRGLYVSMLLERVRQEQFPSNEFLNRIERSLSTPEQLEAYLEILFREGRGSAVSEPRDARPHRASCRHAAAAAVEVGGWVPGRLDAAAPSAGGEDRVDYGVKTTLIAPSSFFWKIS